MTIKRIIVIAILGILVTSCDKIGECGSDIKLGNIQLIEESRQFIPYVGNEELVFSNNQGIEHRLKSIEGRKLMDSRSITRTICSNDMFDTQHEYYKSQMEEIAFTDSNGNQIFWIRLLTFIANDENTNENTIFDLLSVNIGIYNSDSGIEAFGGELKIITREIQNQLNLDQIDELRINSRYIGDTILYNRNFQDVYKAKAYENSKHIYYNKSKGLIALGTTDEFWVLTN
jgi:hypothetical protein